MDNIAHRKSSIHWNSERLRVQLTTHSHTGLYRRSAP